MITIENVNNERDFQIMCDIESTISKDCSLTSWPLHIGGLYFDRYMYGNVASDIFTYGKLIKQAEKPIGYVLNYLDEKLFAVRLVTDNEELYGTVIRQIEKQFELVRECSVVANTLDTALCDALVENGYIRGKEERFQAGLDLNLYQPMACEWQNETISILTEQDIPERVKYADIPTNEPITQKMYEEFYYSDGYKKTLDYVIRDNVTKELAGFVTWWIDSNNQTALLEPVACLPQFRRRGIMRRALQYGLSELKQKGVLYAYVSTSINNEKSQPLYMSVGFNKMGEAYRFSKITEFNRSFTNFV